MESQVSFGVENVFPSEGLEAVPEKLDQKEREAKRRVLPETIWTRLDPDHLQLPVPKHYAAPEAPQTPPTAEVPEPAPEEEAPRPAKSSQPESVGELLKAQNLDIRPQHFYSDAEIRSAHQAVEEHDILPEVSPDAARKKVEQFSAQAEREPETVVRPAAPEAQPSSNDLHLGGHELMLLAGTINVEGTNLLEIFSSGQIDEEGLRRIVAEFLQGKPIEKLLEQEALRQQMKYELDPSLRHSPEGTESIMKRLASGAGARAKKVVNPQHIKHHAGSAVLLVADGFERMLETRDEPPSPAKIAAWTGGIALYLIILFWALKR